MTQKTQCRYCTVPTDDGRDVCQFCRYYTPPAGLTPPTEMVPWSPWAHLRRNHPDYRVIRYHELPPYLMGLQQGNRIWLCSTLGVAEQRSTLAHEILHIERGLPPTDDTMREVEERICDWFASRRLIRATDLARIATRHPRAMSVRFFAFHLWVDTPMMVHRLRFMTSLEVAELESLGVTKARLDRLRQAWGADDDDAPLRDTCASAAIVAEAESSQPLASVPAAKLEAGIEAGAAADPDKAA